MREWTAVSLATFWITAFTRMTAEDEAGDVTGH